ncbi:MAG: FAD-dependent oxidoreductase [Methanomassiliicoccaceae archaeon]|nr:FAD-dependent oxidoreductase [Methanomassiliicoccaceae archaeon]
MSVVIIGAGPAGIQAAIHAARAKVQVTMIGRTADSAMYGAHIENYFGVPGKADGTEILKVGLTQALRSGAVHMDENVTAMERSGDEFAISTESGLTVNAKAVILASGVSRRKLNVPGEKELFGKGVSYCAVCDCNFYKGRRVAIIGDESEAAAAAELMTGYAAAVFWITAAPKASGRMISNAESAGAKIIGESLVEIKGDGKVSGIRLSGGSYLDVDGVFIELGARSSSDLAMDVGIIPDADGTVRTDDGCRTSVDGVFACGDMTGRPWQIAKAVGQGAVAGLNAAAYVRGE